jgi:hypothetical protein
MNTQKQNELDPDQYLKEIDLEELIDRTYYYTKKQKRLDRVAIRKHFNSLPPEGGKIINKEF